MKVGVLHLGPPRHGVVRYGRMLAGELRRRSGLEVVETALDLGVDGRAALARAGRELGSADVVQVQYNRALWGGGWGHLHNLVVFARACRAPLVATAHDVYPRTWGTRRPLRPLVRSAPVLEPLLSRPVYGSAEAGLWLVSRLARRLVVSFGEESRRLAAIAPASALRVVPLFVDPPVSADRLPSAMGAVGRVVTLLGFIHPRKGHDLALEALKLLPPDVRMVFAGAAAPATERFLRELQGRAEALRVADRVTITGYLDEAALSAWIAATDLALCPFRRFSASASLTRWISAGKAILATDLPQIDEYDAMVPGALQRFSPCDPPALAGAIAAAFRAGRTGDDPRVALLAEQLSLGAVAERFAALYEEVGR